MKLNTAFAIVLLGAASQLPSHSLASDGRLRVSYGTSIVAYSMKAMSAFEAETGRKIEPVREAGMGSDSIIIAVDLGNAELGVSGNSWENMQDLVKEKKLTIKNAAKIQHKPLGYDSVNVITFPGGPKELSKEQLKGIFTGKYTSWKQFGGNDVPIQIVLTHNTPSTQKTFSKEVLDGEDIFRKGARTASDYTEAAKIVADSLNAITFISPLTDSHGANKVKHPPVRKEVTAIYLGEPTEDMQKLMRAYTNVLAK